MTFASHRPRAFVVALLASLLQHAPAAWALEISTSPVSRVSNADAYTSGASFCCAQPLIQPGDKALIDDYWADTVIQPITYPVAGDVMGTRAIDPSGAVRTNYITFDGACWYAPGIRSCSALSWWNVGTSIYGKPGLWTLQSMANGVAVRTSTFQVVPYDLTEQGGDGQSIAVKTTTPQPLVVRLQRPDGVGVAGRNVTFNVTGRPASSKPPGGLSNLAVYTGSTTSTMTIATDADGLAKAYFDTGGKAGNYAVAATSPTLAPGTTISFTVTASGTSPLDAVVPEKNLGLDPTGNSACAAATKAVTDHPINIATGNKVRAETDYAGSGPLPLELTRYYNSFAPRAGSFGLHWRSFYDRSIVVTSTTVKNKTTTVAAAVRHDGRVLTFKLTNGLWVGEPDVVDRLENLAGGGYRIVCGNDQVEQYASTGRLASVAAREGFAQALAYDAQGRLAQVSDAFGRTLSFSYDAANRVAAMTDPAGRSYAYGYAGNGNLVGVQYPDLTQRVYHYENGALPRALTGITDENGARYASFSYDASGRAVQSALAGGAQSSTLLYYTNSTRDVQDGAGHYRRYGFAVIQGVARRTGLDNAACASCGYATATTAYSASGFVSAFTDYRGTQTSFVRDARGLETSRTEAVGTPESRTVTTTWHAGFRLPLVITRPGSSTAFTYDANGRVLTRTETDTASGASRRWTYGYNGQGLLASVDGPRTDVADITSYSYGAQGNLATVTNALGHVTRFTSYDAHGRLLSMTDPNGLVTTFAYDVRGRLLARNVGGLVTNYTYSGAGQLRRTTEPDDRFIEHQYDAAQQLVALVDSAGQRIAYTLDGNGRRVREERFDAFGTNVYQRGWTHDALGRVLTESDAQGAVQWRHAYDANGNRTGSTDALGQTASRAYDALDRLRSSTDPLGAATNLAYDARDNLLRVTDPRGVLTQYTYDGLDNRLQEASTDAGTSSFGYDAAGNLRSRSWANGRAVAFTLDALNRVTLEDYGSGVQVAHAFDSGTPNAIGRLVATSDAAGSNSWRYDAWGRVVQATRTTGTRVLATGYGFDSAGRLATLVYPSGRVLGYGYDAAGRVAAINVDGQALLGAIAWQPFGAVKGWVQGNGRSVARSFDRDGRLVTHTFDASARLLEYDAKGRIARIAEAWGQRFYGYDAADRLTAESTWVGNWSYAWDGNGNRLGQTSPWGSTAYGYQAGSNRIASASGLDARVFAHDAAGNMTVEGGLALGYDARNRLATAGGASYAHDALGRRVLKHTGGVNRYYAHDGQRQVIGEYDDAGALSETVWLGTTPVALLRGSAVYWIDADHLDTPRVVRDASDQIVWRWLSEAFGTQAAEEDPSGLGPFEFNHRLPGQMFDRESALHQNDFRDYRAHTGRYVQSDPIGLAGGINTYAYVEANPVSFVDPTGLDAMVCLYPGAGTAGHVGIGINSSSTVGLYPRSESPGLAAITGTPAAVRGDSKQAEQCKVVSTTAEQDKKMADFIARTTANPGTYRLGGNNCTNFVRSVLQQAGVATPGFPGPKPFFDALPPGK